MISCLTNPNCKKIEECENKVNCTTSNEQAEGLTRYVCGRIPCEEKDLYDREVENLRLTESILRKECVEVSRKVLREDENRL